MESGADGGMRLVAMLRGHIVTQLVASAARFRIPDHLGSRSLTVDELADRTGITVREMRRYLRALHGLGVVASAGSDRYRGTELSELLRSDSGPLYGQALMAGFEYYQAWSELDHALRTGGSAFFRWSGTSLWE